MATKLNGFFVKKKITVHAPWNQTRQILRKKQAAHSFSGEWWTNPHHVHSHNHLKWSIPYATFVYWNSPATATINISDSYIFCNAFQQQPFTIVSHFIRTIFQLTEIHMANVLKNSFRELLKTWSFLREILFLIFLKI